MKRVIAILFLASAGVFSGADLARTSAPLYASPQGRPPQPSPPARGPARVDYSVFQHSSHAGQVRNLKGERQELDCAYCHTITKDQPVGRYPSQAPGSNLTHSACLDCHYFTGPQSRAAGIHPQMCHICHLDISNNVTAKRLRPFPNPQVAESQFGDRYSHKSHTNYLDKFECAACHTMKKEVVEARVRFDVGIKQSVPGHPECFLCHFNEKIVSKPKPKKDAQGRELKDLKNTFATNCAGCHTELGAEGKTSAPAVNSFVRQIVNPEKPKEPFSHETHKGRGISNESKEVIKAKVSGETRECLGCHITALRAAARADFFLDPQTKQKQPTVAGCVDCQPLGGCILCHKKEAQEKIADATKLKSSNCLFCHALKTMIDRKTSGLPPASHLGAKAAATPTPTPTPAPKSESRSEAKPRPPAPNLALPKPAAAEKG